MIENLITTILTNISHVAPRAEISNISLHVNSTSFCFNDVVASRTERWHVWHKLDLNWLLLLLLEWLQCLDGLINLINVRLVLEIFIRSKWCCAENQNCVWRENIFGSWGIKLLFKVNHSKFVEIFYRPWQWNQTEKRIKPEIPRKLPLIKHSTKITQKYLLLDNLLGLCLSADVICTSLILTVNAILPGNFRKILQNYFGIL